MTPEVVKVAQVFKAELLAGEEAHQFTMATRYLAVEHALADKMTVLAEKIARFKAEGQTVTAGMVYRLEHWKTLDAQLLDELAKYNGWAAGLIAQRQTELGLLGAQAGAATLDTVGASVVMGGIPSAAVQAMAGFAGDGSPLGALLAELYPLTSDAVAQALVNGVALGQNPTVVARNMGDSLSVGLDRALTIARTEEMRSFRTASLEQYAAAGVQQYQRIAALDDATCIGCLAADGEISDSDQDPEDHVNCRCTVIPIVEDQTPYASDSQAWFDAQERDSQLAIMGPGRLDLYESGQASWSDMWTRTTDETWGNSIVPTNVSDLAGGGMPTAQAA